MFSLVYGGALHCGCVRQRAPTEKLQSYLRNQRPQGVWIGDNINLESKLL